MLLQLTRRETYSLSLKVYGDEGQFVGRGGPQESFGRRFSCQRYVCVYSSLSMKFTVSPAACRFALRPTKGAIFYGPLFF